ncbi:MAG: hypothetical protein JXA92_09450 [candidate division Zixibacteria bacterium]|nr:hypothetical protein [candidate division Zixibacteria bacterium]
MTILKYTIPTDRTNEIQLESQLLSLNWNSATAGPGHVVAYQVLTSFVGYGAPIKITIKNDSGETLAKFDDKVRSNIYIGSFNVPEDCEPGDSLYFEVSLPKNGLKGESEKIFVILPVEPVEMKWSADKVRREDIVTLTVKTHKCPNMTPAKIIIYEYNEFGCHIKVTEMYSSIIDDRLEIDWRFDYPDDTAKIPTQKEMQKYGGAYSAPAYFFKVIINDTSYGDKQKSGLLYFTDFIELELIDETDQPVPEAAFALVPPDGSAALEGRLDQNGFVRLEDVPPGPYDLDFPDLEYELPSKLNSGTRIRSLAVKYFVLLDAGAWQADQEGTATTTFGLIAGSDIALCSWLETYKGKLSDNVTPHIRNLLGYLQLKSPSRGYVIDQVYLKKPVLESNRMLVLIPDLHLHYFKKKAWDNFITKKDWGEIESLEDELVRFLTLTKDWAEHNGVDVEFIQLGDCYEMWESKLVVEKHIADLQRNIELYEDIKNGSISYSDYKYSSPVTLSGNYDVIIKGFKEKKENYQNTLNSFKNPDIFVQEIEKKYPVLTQLFRVLSSEKKLNIIRGNHDNWSNNPLETPLKRGIDNCIRLEHGHAACPYNNDQNWKRGYWVVRNLVIPTEPISRLGDIVKKSEPYLDAIKSSFLGTHTREQMFINYAFSQLRDNDKRVFVMGHTHHPKLMKMNLRQITAMLKEKELPEIPNKLVRF